MSFLVGKIFAYLAVALAGGAGDGWLLRARLRADEQVDTSEMVTLQGRVDQLERALASRDEQIAELEHSAGSSDALERQAAELNAKTHRVVQLEEQVRELQLELAGSQPASDEADSLISALHHEIARLRDALAEAQSAPGRSAAELERASKELEARLVRKAAELDRLEQALAREERKVRELERERELQNKSLHVLHQQLELERDRPRTAHG
jgi:chromosome segregation ATPase